MPSKVVGSGMGYAPLSKAEFIVSLAEDGESSLFIVRPEDVREAIVRCGECVHWREVRMADGTVTHRCSGVMAYVTPDEDGYCKWGRRADDES